MIYLLRCIFEYLVIIMVILPIKMHSFFRMAQVDHKHRVHIYIPSSIQRRRSCMFIQPIDELITICHRTDCDYAASLLVHESHTQTHTPQAYIYIYIFNMEYFRVLGSYVKSAVSKPLT